MAIVRPSIDYRYDHVPLRGRKVHSIRVRSTFPVEIAELTASEAPLALVLGGLNGGYREEYLDVGGRLFTKLQGQRGIHIRDLDHLNRLLRDGDGEPNWHDNPFDQRTYERHIGQRHGCMFLSPELDTILSAEVRLNEGSLAEERAHAMASNLVLIDGVPHRLELEPVLEAGRGYDGNPDHNRFGIDRDLPVSRQHYATEVFHCFRLDQMAEAKAFANGVMGRRAGPSQRAEFDLAASLGIASGRSEWGTWTVEVHRPEVFKFDPLRHWATVTSRNLCSALATARLKGFESLPPEVLFSWAELQLLGRQEEPSPVLVAEVLDKLLDTVSEISGEIPRFIEAHGTDLAIRGDMLGARHLSVDLDESLSDMPAL